MDSDVWELFHKLVMTGICVLIVAALVTGILIGRFLMQ